MKVFCFFGADHKVGTSMISQCVAECIAADNSELRILLIHAEGNRGTDFISCVGESMERIRPYLAEQFIDRDEVLTRAKITDNFYVIGGADNPGTSGKFFPDMAEYFIRDVRQYFDVVICDCGSEPEHALSLGALFSADVTYCVITQSEQIISRFEWYKSLYSRLKIKTDCFVINKYCRSALYGKEYLRSRLMIKDEPVLTVRTSGYGDNAEQDGKSLLNYHDHGFTKDIKTIAAGITAKLDDGF